MDENDARLTQRIADLSRRTHAAFEEWLQDPLSHEAEHRYYALEEEYKAAMAEQKNRLSDR